ETETIDVFSDIIPNNYLVLNRITVFSPEWEDTINHAELPPGTPGIEVQYNCDNSATLTATGIEPGAAILWSTGATSNPITINVTGTITVTQTLDEITSEEGSINITAFSGLFINLTHNNVLCFGGNTGRLVIDPLQGTPPYSYTVTPEVGSMITGPIPGDFVRITGLIAGTYQVTVTDENGCIFSESRTIIEPAEALTSSVVTTGAVCNMAVNGSATITAIGGIPPYSFSLNGGAYITA